MDNENKKPPPLLSDEDIAIVTEAANLLMVDALVLTQASPILAIGALSLALSSAAVIARIPIDVLIQLVTMHYANQVMEETVALLDEAFPKKENEATSLSVKSKKDLN